MPVIGADRVQRALKKMPERMRKHVAEANQKSGEELIRIAKVLIPEKTGASRAAIKGTANLDGSFLCDFGGKAKVIEGRNAPRPFVNPALSVSRKRHSARAKRAMNKAVKESFGG